jgi:hypothetical protein
LDSIFCVISCTHQEANPFIGPSSVVLALIRGTHLKSPKLKLWTPCRPKLKRWLDPIINGPLSKSSKALDSMPSKAKALDSMANSFIRVIRCTQRQANSFIRVITCTVIHSFVILLLAFSGPARRRRLLVFSTRLMSSKPESTNLSVAMERGVYYFFAKHRMTVKIKFLVLADFHNRMTGQNLFFFLGKAKKINGMIPSFSVYYYD